MLYIISGFEVGWGVLILLLGFEYSWLGEFCVFWEMFFRVLEEVWVISNVVDCKEFSEFGLFIGFDIGVGLLSVGLSLLFFFLYVIKCFG